MGKILTAETMLFPYETVEDGAVVVRDGKILAVGKRDVITAQYPEFPVEDYEDAVLSPGFFDLHIHGCLGRVTEESTDAVTALSQYLLTTGTTSFLATAMTEKGLCNAQEAITRQKEQNVPGACIRGIYMEGPFLSPRKLAGAEGSDKDLVEPSLQALEHLLAKSEHIRIMGLGVELPGAAEVMERLSEKGIVVSAAHTKAGYEDVIAAKEHGLSHATHLYNVMSGLHHRRPGVVGAVLLDDDITTELICDGVHVHPAALELAIRMKTPDRIAMITDMTLGGLPDGDYDNGTLQIEVRDNVARFKGVDPDADHAIVGSTRPMLAGIRTVVGCGFALHDAVRMASLTPARLAGAAEETGSLEVGKAADITVFTKDFEPVMTMQQGNIVFGKK